MCFYDDPNYEPRAINHEEWHAAAEPGDPIGNSLKRSNVLSYFFVDIAGHTCAEKLVGLARHSAHSRQHVKSRFRPSLKDQDQILAIERDQLAVRKRLRRSRARSAALKHCQLSKGVAGLCDRKHYLLTDVVFDE